MPLACLRWRPWHAKPGIRSREPIWRMLKLTRAAISSPIWSRVKQTRRPRRGSLTGARPRRAPTRLAGGLDISEFRREFDRRDGKVTGRYDGSVLGFDPDPDSSGAHFGDPSGDPLIAPLTSAAVDLTMRTLNWRPDGPYHLLNGSVEHSWDFGRGINPAQSISDLRQI